MDPQADYNPSPMAGKASSKIESMGAIRHLSNSGKNVPAAADVKPQTAAPDAADIEILQRCLDGSEDAFGELVDKYQQRAFWIAYHVLGRAEAARDVAQEAFVRVHRSIAKFDFARNFYTWFYRIVMNLAIDALRKIQTARATNLDDFAHVLPAEGGAEEPAEVQETRNLVWDVLEHMDGKFRSVLVLRDIHGLSCREIAPILKVTHATVRWRLHRGRQIFREHWERRTKGWRS